MAQARLATAIVDGRTYELAVEHLRKAKVLLPTFAQLADPGRIPDSVTTDLKTLDADEPRPQNLFRVHWYNERDRRELRSVPLYVDLPSTLTGVEAHILVALGRYFPMIAAHKVLAAYGCLVPYLVSGQINPGRHKLIWPSTGNYCRGGIAICRTMSCRGAAVLPAGMSEERFEWLTRWVGRESDIIRTPGTESNVKEIYDKCDELAQQPDAVILNQFSEFGNYLAHYTCTGPALQRVFEDAQRRNPSLRLAAFVAASGSAGTLGAGDFLKASVGSKIAVVEPLECPTLLYNGYGAHNIQGIGDKHVPLIHNVMNTDFIVGVSDHSTDALNLLFNSQIGKSYLVSQLQIPPELVSGLDAFGLSSIANVLGAIKLARRLNLGRMDAILTVATDGASLYASERERFSSANYPDGLNEVAVAKLHGQHLGAVVDDHCAELTEIDRNRVFNLGYFTWVEQRGVSLDDFEQRRHQEFWRQLTTIPSKWDRMIDTFNDRTGLR